MHLQETASSKSKYWSQSNKNFSFTQSVCSVAIMWAPKEVLQIEDTTSVFSSIAKNNQRGSKTHQLQAICLQQS